LRRIGNSLGLILPKEFVETSGLHPDDALRVSVERAVRLDDVFGALRKYRRTPAEWTSAARDGGSP
jgi:antitoxin component of MazEF toxin-antitoxin module